MNQRNSYAGHVVHSSVAALLLVAGAAKADPKMDEQVIATGTRNAYFLSEHGAHIAVVGANGSRMMVTVDGTAGPVLDQMLLTGGSQFGANNSVGVTSTEASNMPILFSPDGDHYAYAGRMGNDAVIFYDGKEVTRGPMNASVLSNGPLCLSPLGKHLFFILTDTNGGIHQKFIIDGQTMPVMPQQNPPAVLFSPDDSHYAYMGMSEDRRQSILVIDGKAVKYVGDDPHFTSDNKLVVLSHDGNKSVLLIDGVPSKQGEGVQSYFLAKGSSKIISIHTRPNPGGQLYYLVVDGAKVPESECLNNITKIVFSPDGQHYMARCVGQSEMWMIVDGKKQLTYNGIGDDFSFSADSSRYAYLASSGAGQFMVVDGKENEVGPLNVKPVFAPKGSRLGYVMGENRLKMQVVVDGKASAVTNDVPGLVFSPDGSRYAHQFNTMMSPGLMVDGTPMDGFVVGTFAFSPDSKHLTFTGQRASDRINGLFFDGQMIYQQAGRFTRQAFSDDSKHFYFSTVETGQPVKSVVYVDGKAVEKFDANANAVFENLPESWSVAPDGVLTFLAFTPDGLKKYKVTPDPATSLDTIVADAKAAQEKAIADAAKAKADADAARAKAAADAQKARDDAAAARAKAQQDAAAARLKAQQDAAAARAARRRGGTAPPP